MRPADKSLDLLKRVVTVQHLIGTYHPNQSKLRDVRFCVLVKRCDERTTPTLRRWRFVVGAASTGFTRHYSIPGDQSAGTQILRIDIGSVCLGPSQSRDLVFQPQDIYQLDNAGPWQTVPY